jgi:hypothetical protein
MAPSHPNFFEQTNPILPTQFQPSHLQAIAGDSEPSKRSTRHRFGDRIDDGLHTFDRAIK